MTVAELIEALQKMPQDAIVAIGTGPVFRVELTRMERVLGDMDPVPHVYLSARSHLNF